MLNYATALGSLRQVAITDMQEQHDEFLDMHAQAPTPRRAPAGARPRRSTGARSAASPRWPSSSGRGCAEAFAAWARPR